MKRSGLLYGMFGIVFLMTSVITSGCGGGGGGGAAAQPKPHLSGTVASGGALVGALITLKDSATGTIRTATTDSNGAYSIDTTGLTPPFLLLATDFSNTFYSVSADANTTSTVNITPLTDLIIRTWYDVQGVSVDTAFADPVTNPPPSPTVVAVISSVVKNLVQLWLNAAGVATDSFNLISTPFTANGTGIDHVLDQTTVDPLTGAVLISSGSVTQNSTILTGGTGSMIVVTTTTGTGGDSTSTGGTVVPVSTPEQSALAGITTMVNNFAATVNARGSSLAASDLLPYMDPSGLWGGLNRAQAAQQIAFFFKGTTVSFSDIAIKSMPTATTAETVFKLSQSAGGQTNTETIEFFFTEPTSTWFMSGDDRIAEVEVRALMVRNLGSGASGGTNLSLEVNVNAPRSAPTVTSLNSVVITGGPWTSATLSYGSQNVASWDSSLTTDSYSIYEFNPTISGGELFTIDVAPSSDPTATVTYTMTLNAITTEPIMITNLTGTTLAAATVGVQKTVNWTLPKTFAISMIRLGTVAQTGPPDTIGTFKCDDSGSQNVLGISATTAHVTIPATCHGLPTFAAEIYLQVFGINGELTSVYYTYNYGP